MRSLFSIISLGFFLFAGGNLLAVSTNATPGTIFLRMTLLGTSEGMLYGSTLNDTGESIAFLSPLNGTNDTLCTIANPNSTNPSVFTASGDFSSGTNIPLLPVKHSRFTEIRGYSQGVLAGNYDGPGLGNKAFLWNTNGTLISIVYPGSRPGSTVLTGISQGTAAGNYTDAKGGRHGFAYSVTTSNFLRIDVPKAVGRTYVHGIAQGVLFGSFVTPFDRTQGFVYATNHYTPIIVPEGPLFTEVTGYAAGAISGSYRDSNRIFHGFVTSGTNTTALDNSYAPSAYLRLTGGDTNLLVGNEYNPNDGFMENTTDSTNTFRPIFLTTNTWQTPVGNYPLHVTSAPPTKWKLHGLILTQSTNSYSDVSGISIGNSESDSWNSGSYSLGSSNSISGGTTINAGTLSFGVTITISGSGGLTTFGSGTMTLSGSNTYSGSTIINSGTLVFGGNLGSFPTNEITLTGNATLHLGASNIANPINGLVFSSDTNTSSLTISNSGSSDYILGNFGSSNSLTISPGVSDTISFADYTGTNSDIALTLTKSGVTNPTGGAFLILPGTNKVEFLLP